VNLVREDEADNRILECALAAGADTIITGDPTCSGSGGFSGRES
jgi:predicted nucleic acid-binding protein